MLLRFLRPQWAVLGLGATVYAAALVIVRGRPTVCCDAGIFLSVAARLLRGDRLYSGVWDNKPPFFYYTAATSLDVAGWRGPFLIDVLWIAVAAICMWLLLETIGGSSWSRAVGLVVYPLLLTGSWYYAVYSELPTLALAPAFGWLWLRGSPSAAGAVLGVAAFFRPDYGFLFLALFVAPAVVRAIDGAALRRNALRLLAGFAAAAAASVAVVAARGELTAYVATMRTNVGYPNQVLVQMGEQSGVLGHLTLAARMLTHDSLRSRLLALVSLALCVLLVAPIRERFRGRSSPERPDATTVLSAFFVGTVLATAMTLALTALWDHSLELIALPATFATCLLVSRIDAAVRSRTRRLVAIVPTAAACVIAFGGLSFGSPSSPESSWPLAYWWRTPRSVSAVALDKAAAELHWSRELITYARLGYNNEEAHALFIDARLKLACPLFHQYTFSSNLDQALACIRDRRPELLLVGPSFGAYESPTTQRWDAFVSDSRRLLRARYLKVLEMPDEGGKVEVWRRQ